MCWMGVAGAGEKRPSMKGIPSTNTIWPLQKWKRLSYKARKQEDGGCSSRIKNLSPAVIRIIYWRAVMRYRRDGCGPRKEDERFSGFGFMVSGCVKFVDGLQAITSLHSTLNFQCSIINAIHRTSYF